jgi:hypothetical protein
MHTNFHAFVFISTIVVYIILRSYKKLEPKNKGSSNLIYVLLIPVILYGGQYYFNKSNTTNNNDILNNDILNDNILNNERVSSDILTTPYPVSSDSFSI